MPKKRPARSDIRPEDLRGLACAEYVRDSTKDQAEGYGPAIQRNANKAFAERYGLRDTGLAYEEYVSGGKLQGRTEIQRAIADLRAGRFVVLLVGWTHRFARSMEDAASLRREITEAGGVLVYTAQGIVSGQKASRVGENVLHVIDQEYRDNLADLVAAGLRAKFDDDGANGMPPLGTKHLYIRRDGTIAEGPEKQTRAVRVYNPSSADILRVLLTRYTEYGSYRKTAEYLNDHGHRSSRGRVFTPASVRYILDNPYYGPEEIVRFHPGWSDEEMRPTPKDKHIFPSDIHEMWQRARDRRDRATRLFGFTGHRHIYPLHGVLRCFHCGSVYHGQAESGKRQSRHKEETKECPRPRTTYTTPLEDQLCEGLEGIALPRDWRTQLRSILAQPERDDSKEERRNVERKIERLRFQHSCDAIDDATFAREFKTLREHLQRLPERVSVVDDFTEPVRLFRSIGKIVGHPVIRAGNGGLELFRQFCDLAFDSIEIEGSRLVRATPRNQYRELFALALAHQGLGLCAAERTRPNSTQEISLFARAGAIHLVGLDSLCASFSARAG